MKVLIPRGGVVWKRLNDWGGHGTRQKYPFPQRLLTGLRKGNLWRPFWLAFSEGLPDTRKKWKQRFYFYYIQYLSHRNNYYCCSSSPITNSNFGNPGVTPVRGPTHWSPFNERTSGETQRYNSRYVVSIWSWIEYPENVLNVRNYIFFHDFVTDRSSRNDQHLQCFWLVNRITVVRIKKFYSKRYKGDSRRDVHTYENGSVPVVNTIDKQNSLRLLLNQRTLV